MADVKMYFDTEIVRLTMLVEAYKEYNQLLSDECSDLVGAASVHGWKSTRVEAGDKCRAKIEILSK